MLSIVLMAALAAAPSVGVASPDLGGFRAPQYSGSLDWSLCTGGGTSYPCAAIETTVKPFGGTVTVSAPASIWPVSATGAILSTSANDLALLDSSGTRIYGAAEHSNLLAYSSPAAWTLTNVTGDDVSASCPLWVDGVTRMDLLTSTDASPTAAIDAANSRCRCVWLALPTGDSAHDVTVSDYSGDGGAATTLSATPTRVCATATGHTGIKLAWTHGANRVCAMRGVGQNTTVCGVTNPAPQAAGSPVSGTADDPRTTRAKTTDRCVGVKMTPEGGWASGFERYLWSRTEGANSDYLRITSGNAIVYVAKDSGGNTKYITNAISGTGEKAVIACRTVEGLLRLWVDSTLYDANVGSWTTTVTTEPTATFLGQNANRSLAWNGAMRCHCEGPSESAVRKCFAQRCP